jgi:toxin ParE1/3/4
MAVMKKYQVKWTDTAVQDLAEIVKFISAANPANALNVLRQIGNKANDLYILPDRGRVLPELREVEISIYRELLISPWRIIYRYERNTVFVLAVLDGRRELSGILLDRLLR